MNLPKGHLSPSQLGQWERCEIQWQIFSLGGAKAPPDFALEAKKLTHEVILESDLAGKITTGHNLANSELIEIHRAKIESKVLPLAREDPNLEMPADKAVTEESAYFGKIVSATEEFRQSVKPVAVEKKLDFTAGGVPLSVRLDLISDEGILERVEDLKRLGQAPSAGSASKSRQLTTYAMGTGLREVGFAAIVENKTPKMVREQGTVSDGEIARVARQYQVGARQMLHAMETGDFMPVDHGDKARAWICSARFCGAWKIGARAWNTGELIECKFGEKAEVKVSLSTKGGQAK